MSALFSLSTCQLGATASARTWSFPCGPHVTSNLTVCFQGMTSEPPSPCPCLRADPASFPFTAGVGVGGRADPPGAEAHIMEGRCRDRARKQGLPDVPGVLLPPAPHHHPQKEARPQGLAYFRWYLFTQSKCLQDLRTRLLSLGSWPLSH